MSNAHTLPARLMTVDEFLGFYETRPDGEHWELIDGVPVMMTPPSMQHQIVASTIEQRLTQVLEGGNWPYLVVREGGLQLGTVPDFRPEPEIVVVDAGIDLTRSFAEQFYMAVEVVSPSDRRRLSRKIAFYRDHPSCHTILVVEPFLIEAELHTRRNGEWEQVRLCDPTSVVEIGPWGSLGTLEQIYRRTPLNPNR